jgi:hypothetical protein
VLFKEVEWPINMVTKFEVNTTSGWKVDGGQPKERSDHPNLRARSGHSYTIRSPTTT